MQKLLNPNFLEKLSIGKKVHFMHVFSHLPLFPFHILPIKKLLVIVVLLAANFENVFVSRDSAYVCCKVLFLFFFSFRGVWKHIKRYQIAILQSSF